MMTIRRMTAVLFLLSPASAYAGGAFVDCSAVGSAAYDWDGDLLEDGCRGTNVVIDPSVTVPGGTKMGDDITIMRGSVLGTGNTIHDDATLASGVTLGNGNSIRERAVLGRNVKIGSNVTVLADSTLGRSALVGDGSLIGGTLGYFSTVGTNAVLSDIALGNLATIGASTTPSFAINCPGPLVLARSTTVATDSTDTFTCTGLVVVGPTTSIESASVGANVRVRKNSDLLGDVTLGSDIRIGREVVLNGDVELSTDTTVRAGVELCDTAAPFSGFIARDFTDPSCP